MYLLMLLATFVSAIYGYNLSARVDYDRELARKKALGVTYKFIFQEDRIQKLVRGINSQLDWVRNKEGMVTWVLPGDMIYADFKDRIDGHDTYLYYKPVEENPIEFHMNDAGDVSFAQLPIGLHFYDGIEMVTKIMCLKAPMAKEEIPVGLPEENLTEPNGDCQSPTDLEGFVTNSCCNLNSYRYLVTYKKLDARWVNRLTNGVNLDFMAAVLSYHYADNIGVITWENNQWMFRGMLDFAPAYETETAQYHREHPEVEEETLADATDVLKLRRRSLWSMPNWIFKEDYFKNKNGNDICTHGCLFRIKEF